ncbi:MAG: hypothetical protein JNL61_08890 [Rhizobiaceae bacterium]|nr:hypothetical protein [Rhizobiaceae bacterium]
MITRTLLAAGVALAFVTQAMAQQAETPPPPPPPAEDAAMPPPPPGKGPGDRPWRRGGPEQAGKGFRLEFGRGVGLRVDCGDEPIRTCVEAVQPLIAKFPNFDPSMMPPPPPPPVP